MDSEDKLIAIVVAVCCITLVTVAVHHKHTSSRIAIECAKSGGEWDGKFETCKRVQK